MSEAISNEDCARRKQQRRDELERRAGQSRLARSVEEQAVRLGLSRSFLYTEMKLGRLRFVKIGKRRLVTDADADTYLAAHRLAV